MEIILRSFFVLIVFLSCPIFAEDIPISWGKTDDKMRHFRSFSDVLSHTDLNETGVSGRYISGSGQFSSENLKELAPKVRSIAGEVDKIILIDLRLESHGFINTVPVAWKGDQNLDKSIEEIFDDETTRLQDLFIAQEIDGYPIYFIATEQELAIENEFEHVRLPTLDHSHPRDEIVDEFLNIIKDNPASWLHVHCAVGKGRTTTFLAMFDMFYNAKDVSFDEILKRQKEIGGQDFKKYLDTPNKHPKKQALFLARLAFLEKFYQFCHDENPYEMTWQEWIANLS